MRIVSALALLALAVGSTAAFAAEPTDPTTAAIFAGGNLTFNGFNTVVGGPVVANGNVIHNGGSLNLPTIYAGGTFTKSGAAFQNSTGDVLFGGTITEIGGPGSVLGGNVTTGGSVSFGSTSTSVNGNVTAAGSVNQPFTFSAINGSVLAGGDVNLRGTVTGGVIYGGTFTGSAHIAGAIVHGGPVAATPFVPLTLPAGRNLTPGSSDITLATFESRSITPGTYGALKFDAGNTISLTAGQYVFSSITSGFSLNQMSFDTSQGPINIFVAGDYDFNVVQIVNGISLFQDSPNPADAPKIFLEVGHSFTADSSFCGTVFAPNGDALLNSFVQVTGRVLAGGNVTVNSGGVAAPEPASVCVLGSACSILLLRRRKSARRC